MGGRAMPDTIRASPSPKPASEGTAQHQSGAAPIFFLPYAAPLRLPADAINGGRDRMSAKAVQRVNRLEIVLAFLFGCLALAAVFSGLARLESCLASPATIAT